MKGFSDAFQQLGNKEYSDKDYLHAEKSSLKNWFYSFLKDIKILNYLMKILII